MNRRNLLKALSCVPVVAAFPSLALAKKAEKPANLLSETEGLGKTLGYVHDSTKSKHVMYKKGRNCSNCIQFNQCAKPCTPLSAAALKKATYAPCTPFPGKVVSKTGWCISYSPKA